MEGKRVTIKEISKIVNVSPTTVTKALTGKKQVSEEKRALIIKVAGELGYKPNKFARALVRSELAFGIVIPEEPHEFIAFFKKGLEYGLQELSDLKVKGTFSFFRDNNATEETRAALISIAQTGIDGLIVAPGFGCIAYSDVMREIMEDKKIPVVFHGQVVGDLKGVACVKTNTKVIGQMAAEYLGLCLKADGDVAVITTNREYESHKEIIASFLAEAGRQGLKVRAILENYDRKELSYAQTEKILKDHPEVRGIYVTSYNSMAVCECIQKQGLTDRVAVIGHDLFPEMLGFLKTGALRATVYQNPFLQGRTAVKTLYEYLTEKKVCLGDIPVKPELVMKSNYECYRYEY